MTISWFVQFHTDFDLEQAVEDFDRIMEWNPDKDPDSAIYDAVNANFFVETEEYIDISEGVEAAARALRKAVGGFQTCMNLSELG